MFAIVEVKSNQVWQLGDELVADPDLPNAPLVPKDIAPPWGWEQIQFYVELSGERGLPRDVSIGLRSYLEAHWQDEAYGLSWMTLAEIKMHLANATDQAYFQFSPDWFDSYPYDDEHIRVVFWHD